MARFVVCMACLAGAVATAPLAHLGMAGMATDIRYWPAGLLPLALLTTNFCGACLTVYSTWQWLRERDQASNGTNSPRGAQRE
jgi:hypothetical protein